jgi:hypothetical protein
MTFNHYIDCGPKEQDDRGYKEEQEHYDDGSYTAVQRVDVRQIPHVAAKKIYGENRNRL